MSPKRKNFFHCAIRQDNPELTLFFDWGKLRHSRAFALEVTTKLFSYPLPTSTIMYSGWNLFFTSYTSTVYFYTVPYTSISILYYYLIPLPLLSLFLSRSLSYTPVLRLPYIPYSISLVGRIALKINILKSIKLRIEEI